MNYRNSHCMSLLMLIACLSLSLNATTHYASVAERQQAVLTAYNALIQKWQPALTDLSPLSLMTILNEKKRDLQIRLNLVTNHHDSEDELESIINDINAWPFTHICAELDADIIAGFKLIYEARILNMSDLDVTPLQNLRAEIDSLPCLKNEQANRASLVSTYSKYLVGLGVACATYLCWNNPLSAAHTSSSCTCSH